MVSKNWEYMFKVVIIGDAATGKTSLLRRYCEGEFSEKYSCTVGVDFHVKVVKTAQNKTVKLQLWDTAGQERYRVMTASYYRCAKACIIVYDITRRETFDSVRSWATQYQQHNTLAGSKACTHAITILANKCDLASQRLVPTEEGVRLATELGCQFSEVSAKEENGQLTRVFSELAEALVGTCEPAQEPSPPQQVMKLQVETLSKESNKKSCCE